MGVKPGSHWAFQDRKPACEPQKMRLPVSWWAGRFVVVASHQQVLEAVPVQVRRLDADGHGHVQASVPLGFEATGAAPEDADPVHETGGDGDVEPPVPVEVGHRASGGPSRREDGGSAAAVESPLRPIVDHQFFGGLRIPVLEGAQHQVQVTVPVQIGHVAGAEIELSQRRPAFQVESVGASPEDVGSEDG